MTISSASRKAGPYTGNGVTTSFSFSFKVFTTADLYVERYIIASGDTSTLVLNTDYTVTLNADQNANPGGNVIITPAYSSAYQITITSTIANLQLTDLTNQGGFYPSVITMAFDKLTILVQQLAEVFSRTIKLPLSTPSDVSTTFPLATSQRVIGWDALGKNLINYSSTELAGIISSNLSQFSPIPTFAALASTPMTVGQIVQTRCHTSGVKGALQYKGVSSAGLTPNGGTISATAAAGVYAQAIGIDYITPEMFGATGDGVANDSPAIQLALDSIPSTGGALLLLTKYLLSSAVTVANRHVTIFGLGQEVSQLLVNNTTGGIFYSSTGSSVTAHIFYLKDIAVIATKAGSNGIGISAIWTTGSGSAPATPHCFINGVNVRSTSYNASATYFTDCIKIVDAQNSRFNNISINQNSSLNTTGINLAYTTNAQAFKVMFDGLSCQGCQYGVKGTGWIENIQFSNFEIAVPRYGIYFDCATAVTTPLPLVTLVNGHVNGTNIGIYFNFFKSIHITNVNAAITFDATTSLSTTYALFIQNGNEILVSNSLFNNVAGSAANTNIVSLYAVTCGTFANNVITSNWYAGKTTMAMTITNGSQNIEVDNNRFRSLLGNSDTALLIQPALGSNEEIEVNNNRFENFSTFINIIDVHDGSLSNNRFTGAGTKIIVGGTRYAGLVIKNNLPFTSRLSITGNSATPSAAAAEDGLVTINNAGATTVTNILDGYDSMQIEILAGNGNTTIQHNANIFLNGSVNFVMGAAAILVLRYTSGNWREISRRIG